MNPYGTTDTCPKNNKTNQKSVKEPHDPYYLSKRFVAYLIDWYLGALVTGAPIAFAAKKLTGSMEQHNLLDFSKQQGIMLGLISLLCALFYFVVIPTWIFPGQTVGKKIMQLQIVHLDGTPANGYQLLWRYGVIIFFIEGALFTVSSIIHQLFTLWTGINWVSIGMYLGFLVTGSSVIWMFYKREYRFFHDYWAKTKVIAVSKNKKNNV